jgi:hypothetical protein
VSVVLGMLTVEGQQEGIWQGLPLQSLEIVAFEMKRAYLVRVMKVRGRKADEDN